jgi:excisionase family DNA binding protein
MKTLEDFRRHLQETFDTLDVWCQYGEPDWYRGLEISEMVEEAGRLACRFGCDPIALPSTEPMDALAAIGKLLAWADARRPYFDSRGACNYLGITEQSLYGLVERKRLVPLRGPRRTYRFTREQLDAYLAQDSDV